MKKENIKILVAGLIIGIIGVLLVTQGNPQNMGICMACFYRDIAGAIGLHSAPPVQYLRPEIPGFILGAFIASLATGDFRARGGSSTVVRFLLGVLMTFGALVFLGCPLRLILRLASGDLNAIIGLIGFIAGILIGIAFLRKGYTLGKAQTYKAPAGYAMPAVAVFFLILIFVQPEFLRFSTEGPGSMHAPVIISLIAGLVVGVLLQRTRICSAGAFRDAFLIKNFHYLWGVLGIFLGALLMNVIFAGGLNIGFEGQPIAHTNHVFNFLGMSLVGLTGIMLGGCPIRQTILAGEGDADAAITCFGIIVGAALAHNWSISASGEGVPMNGQIAVILGLIISIAIAFIYSREEA